jgi:GGDEF domain-containing protein
MLIATRLSLAAAIILTILATMAGLVLWAIGAVDRAAFNTIMADLRIERSSRQRGGVTASLGVAIHPMAGRSPAELIAAADQMLYRAKKCRQGPRRNLWRTYTRGTRRRGRSRSLIGAPAQHTG